MYTKNNLKVLLACILFPNETAQAAGEKSGLFENISFDGIERHFETAENKGLIDCMAYNRANPIYFPTKDGRDVFVQLCNQYILPKI